MVEIIDMNKDALNLPRSAMLALKRMPRVVRYVGDEEKSAGSWRAAVYDSLQVSRDEAGVWHVEDIDGMVFHFVWDGKAWKEAS